MIPTWLLVKMVREERLPSPDFDPWAFIVGAIIAGLLIWWFVATTPVPTGPSTWNGW